MSVSPSNPLVSIIIPTHNRIDLLKRALASCFSQSYAHIEILVVNDGSKDGTGAWLEQLGPGVKVLHNISAKGAPYCRNLGAENSTGAYLSFLDDDDELLPGKVEKQLAYLEDPANAHIGVLTCDMLKKGAVEEQTILNRNTGDVFIPLLSKYCVQGIHTMLIRREVYQKSGGFDESLDSNQEYDLMIQMARHTQFHYLPEVLVVVYVTEGQISTNFRKKRDGTIKFIRKNHHLYKQAGGTFYLHQMARLWAIVAFYQASMVLGLRFYRLLVP